MQAEKGFTLIELMVVVAIIGTLSLIAIPAYQKYAKKTSEVACLAETKAFSDKMFIDINTGVEIFDDSSLLEILKTLNLKASACKTLVFNPAAVASEADGTTVAVEATLANISGEVKNPVDAIRKVIKCEWDEGVSCTYHPLI